MSNINNSSKYGSEKINAGEFYSHLRKRLAEQDIDFVATTYSELHSIGIDAFVYDLAQQINKRPKGIIAIDQQKLPAGQYQRTLNMKNLACNAYADIDFLTYGSSDDHTGNKTVRKKEFSGIFRYCQFALGLLYTTLHKQAREKIFFLSAVRYDLNYLQLFSNTAISGKYTPIFVLIEEGVGTYVTDDVWRLVYKQSVDLQKGWSLTSSIRFHYFVLIKKLFSNVLSRFVVTEDRLLFCKTDGKLIENKKMIDLYKKVIECRTRFIHRASQDGGIRNALIATHPLSEDSVCSPEFELSLVQQLIELFNRNGIHPIVKPHPTEKSDKYDKLGRKSAVSIMNKRRPIEEIMLTENPICIVGNTSTALLTAHVLNDIPAISFVDILLNVSDNELFQVAGRQFKELAEDLVHFVSSTAELERLIRDISCRSIETH